MRPDAGPDAFEARPASPDAPVVEVSLDLAAADLASSTPDAPRPVIPSDALAPVVPSDARPPVATDAGNPIDLHPPAVPDAATAAPDVGADVPPEAATPDVPQPAPDAPADSPATPDAAVDLAPDLPAAPEGTPCTAATQCASGHCTDNRCCATACLGSCERCNAPGLAGRCEPVTLAEDGSCNGALWCDSASLCRKKPGVPCGNGAECGAGGDCAGGRCCKEPCSLGVCDETGACLGNEGAACSSAATCTTKHCVDGRCCLTAACQEDCSSCTGPGGTCVFDYVNLKKDPAACGVYYGCDRNVYCRRTLGKACTSNFECIGERCGDGNCTCTLCVSPEVIDLGTIPLGDRITYGFVVQNKGTEREEPFEVVMDPLSSTDFSVLPPGRCDEPRDPGQQCVFTVQFQPTEDARRLANFELRRDMRVLARISVAGTGVPPNRLPRIYPNATSRSRLDVGETATEEFMIQNPPGGAPIQAITFDGRNASDFSRLGDPTDCIGLAAGGVCHLTVQLKPGEAGTRFGRLLIKTALGTAAAGLTSYGVLP